MKTKIRNILLVLNCYFNLFFLRLVSARFCKIKPLLKSNFTNNNKTCVVLGNGPSLKGDIQKILEKDDVDFFCVNHMAESEYFRRLKPNKYALFDAYFWAQDADEKLKVKREILFSALNENVSWEMFIYIPRGADLEYLQKKIENPNINIVKLEIIPISVINYKKIPQILLQGKYGPPACNVVIYSMYLSIIASYDYIELYGADLSFTEDVIVDQKTNKLMIEYKHFYGESTFEPLLENPQKIVPFTMESLYKTTYMTFYAHNMINQMALLKGIKVINKSSYSLIDAYERG